MISPFLYDTIKNKSFGKGGKELMVFDIIIIVEMIIFLVALLCEIITTPTIVINDEDE